jgi:hypothetical protein
VNVGRVKIRDHADFHEHNLEGYDSKEPVGRFSLFFSTELILSHRILP